MSRMVTVIVEAVLIAFLAGCSTVYKYKVMLPSTWIGMERLAEGVYIDSGMDDRQRHQLLEEIERAKEKVNHVWGSIETRPEIYACSTEVCFQSFGGSTNRANSIGGGKLLLSPRALNSAMVSHEWSHTELYPRVGGLWAWRRIPNWFDEGVAVMVSEDPRHGEQVWSTIINEGIVPPPPDELSSHRKWIQAVKKFRDPDINPNNLAVVYTTAGHAVREWYDKAGRDGLLELVQQVKEGSSFEDVYVTVAGSERRRRRSLSVSSD